MKTHYYGGSSSEDVEQAPCGVWLGEGSGLTGEWGRVDCIRCQSRRKKINESAAAEERAIVEQMGDMAAFMREEGNREHRQAMTNKPMFSVELLTCPMCAGRVREPAARPIGHGDVCFVVSCNCGLSFDGGQDIESAVRTWNRRAKPAAPHQGYPVNRLSYSQGDRRYVNGWNDACSHWEVRSAPEAHESECTSCDGSGEYTDAIGDWRGYCTCPAGVDAEGIKGLKP